MTIDNNTKIDVLWKKVIFGSTETSKLKAGSNESIPSPNIVLNEDIYSQSDNISKPAPALSTAVVDVNVGPTRIECIQDVSVSNNRTWFAVADPTKSRNYIIAPNVKNALSDWIPPSFHSSYILKVYSGDPLISGTLLNSLVTNEEWLFDYNAGTLFFPNNIPVSLTSNTIFIEGYRYVGRKGLISSTNNSAIEQSLTYTTALLQPGATELFDLQTGAISTILDLNVNVPSIVTSNSTSTRTDTNPYTFNAIIGHLFDDGSYLQGGIRFFGQRYAFVSSRDGTGKTYWTITNNSLTAVIITMNITII